MARPLRIQYEGAFYHVTARGNEKKAIFLHNNDRKIFLHILDSVVKKYRWIIHAYCLMNNHYHLVIETPMKNLSAGIRQLNGVYALAFNKKYMRVGHLFQGRYKSHLIEKEGYFLEGCRYIVLNPIRAGLVNDPSEWRYSSYPITSGQYKHHKFLCSRLILSFFSENLKDAQKEYTIFIKNGIGRESPFKKAKGGFILGGEKFVNQIMQKKRPVYCEEITKREKLVHRPALKTIFADHGRNEGISIAVNQWGYQLKKVGQFVGLHYSRVSRIAKKAKSKT